MKKRLVRTVRDPRSLPSEIMVAEGIDNPPVRGGGYETERHVRAARRAIAGVYWGVGLRVVRGRK